MKNYIFLILIALLTASCARVGSPVGGTKDSIAPQFLGSNIDSSRVNVPRDIHQLRLDFDEYITLKDISKNLIISPPITQISKILPSNLSTKFVLIQWKDTLKANTTYSFNFGNAILDNNEGNPLPYFNYAFSTGDKIDNLYISGEVKDAFASKKKGEDYKDGNIVVGLFQAKDSMDYRQKPYYITKADPDGYFELNYLSPGKYKIVAFEDANSNSVFDNGSEKVGFQKEEIELKSNISGLKFIVYPSKKIIKYAEWKPQVGGILLLFEGNPESIKIEPKEGVFKNYKVVHQPKSDSVNIYFDAQRENIGLTNSQNLKFSYEAGAKKDSISLFYKYDPKALMELSNRDGNLLPPKKPFKVYSNLPVENIITDKFTMTSDSIKQNFSASISKTNPHEILINADYQEGKKYQLTILKESVTSYFESIAKSYQFNFEIDKSQNYGSFTVNLINKPTHPFWIEIIDSGDKVAYSKKSTEAGNKFTELKPETYTVRILVDNNENGVWDTADFTTQSYAEDVFMFNKKLLVKPFWEIVESWDLLNQLAVDGEEDLPETAPQNNPATKEAEAIQTQAPKVENNAPVKKVKVLQK
ncbi:Ig-like domain-containing protein [Halpernia frigidisoli]|uniref:Ig-like domain-containing protein n=1 Tax=Halpernia frigidisoli TaxID=1125876 RepID=A0A1I3I526_9FLAO|nr:Ig-like domain-containing protein [Halpernia frigidisoli]SFI43078.1 Ig-like domain-containing protein [Halpernia frigidisoli]